jgi:hypothetical protein
MAKQIELTYTPQQLAIIDSIKDGIKYVVITKGRRFGATMGFCHACIEWALEGEPILWGDTINGNIDRYIERYFEPALKINGIDYKYNSQQKKLIIGKGYIDFRSADRPENWEGFGYKKIFLNEAGIILKNEYLYTNAVLPMLMDYSDSVLIAAGVPKGKWGKNKQEHKFFSLYKAAKNKEPHYILFEYSSYDNPCLAKQDIEDLESEIKRMNPAMVEQEIYGKFVDGAAGTLWSPDMIVHTDKIPQLKRIVTGVDPSGSVNGDEVGIITAGIAENGNIYILSDKTKGATPLEWATLCTNELKAFNGDAIVAERNYGGDMVKANILNVDRFTRVIEVSASKGKDVRAEPVVGLYEQGKVFHARGLFKLENEMLTWVKGVGDSPNRIDALVWAVTELTTGTRKEVW